MPDEFVLPEGENEEPVSILVKMVEDGEVDPWNIDIADLTDKFMTKLEERRQMNLRVSGLSIFYLSVLLRLKAESLAVLEAGDDDYESNEEYDDDEFSGRAFGQIEQLEHEINRRLHRKDVRQRRTNMYELLKELRLAEKEERRRQRRKRLIDDEDELFAEEDTEDISNMPHEENYEEIAREIREYLRGHPDSRDTGVNILEIARDFHMPLYMVYLPCLFLVLEGSADLEQDEIYGDLWVVCTDGE